jgi:hypothetical protein
LEGAHALAAPILLLIFLVFASGVSPMRPAADRDPARIVVPAGADLQAAVDRARPGDTLLLEPGATYVGNFTLPATNGTDYITIRSAADPTKFPANGRVGPQHAQWMPILRSPSVEPALATRPGAHHWRLQWLSFAANRGGIGDIITLGDGSEAQNTTATIPHHLELDGLIIRGDPTLGQKRGIALNSASTTVRNSDIRDIMTPGQDSQAICGWNGPGPFVIENNFLSAAGENVMFGGSDPFVPRLVPSDIVFRGNFVTKPVAWRAGTPWTVKNLFELKNARRVLIEGNVFENNWVSAQTGYAILFTPMNQDGRAPWTEISNITFQFNIVRHVASAINILGYDYHAVSLRLRGLQIRENLFLDVDGSRWGGDGRFLMIGDEPADVTVDHNTVIQSGSVLQLYGMRDGNPRSVQNLRFTNNLTLHNQYGIIGDSLGIGNPALAAYASGADVRRNVLAGGNAAVYPPDNLFPSVRQFESEFVDFAAGDYRLRRDSRYRTAGTDGLPIGANVEAIRRRAPPGDFAVPR